MPNWLDFVIIGGKAVFIWGFALTLIPVLIWFERKGAAFIQDRAGPNRAAILGIRLAGFIHNIADVVKLLMKEMMIPPHVNRTYFMIAPVLGFTFILSAFAVIPWADTLNVAGPRDHDAGRESQLGHLVHPGDHVAERVRHRARGLVVE